MEKDLKELNDSFSILETDVIDIKSNLDELTAQVADFSSCVDDIENSMSSDTAELSTKIDSILDSLKEIDSVKSDIKLVAQNTNSNTEDIQQLQKSLADKVQSISSSIGKFDSLNETFLSLSSQVQGLNIDEKFATSQSSLISLIEKLEKKLEAVNTKYRNIAASGGASLLSQLQDVTISSPTANQALLYNATTSRWTNSTINLTGSTLPVLASHPSSPGEGYQMINSTTNTIDVYFLGTWNQTYTFSVVSSYYLLEDGVSHYLLENGSGSYILG